MSQLEYGSATDKGFNGMLAEPFSLRQVDSGLVEDATLALGAAVKYGTGDDQYLACAADEAVNGVALFDPAKEKQEDGTYVFQEKETFPVLSKGRYWAAANSTLAKGDVVAYDPATGLVGPAAGGTTTLAFGKAMSAVTYDVEKLNLVIVELDY